MVEQLVKTVAPQEPSVGSAVVVRLQRLRGELAEFAYALEGQRKLDAADAVNTIAARVAEIESELLAAASEAVAP